MDPSAMDDKLYYVEGPEQQVLGPMTMIEILEGIAAGAVLEDARICEVGAQEWIQLSDVAYTREVEGEAPAAAAPSADSPAEDLPASARPYDLNEEQPASMQELDGAPADPDELPASARPYDLNEEQPASMQEHEDAPADDLPESARPYDSVPDELPASAMPYDSPAPDELPESARPYEEANAGADDFALAMDGSQPAETVIEESAEFEESSSSRKWLVPTIAAVTVPLVAAVWLFSSGKLGGDSEEAPTEVATTPAPEVASQSPVDAGWQLLQSGDLSAAQRQFRAAIEDDPESARSHHGLGLARYRKGNYDGAVSALAQAQALTPEDGGLLVDLGNAQLAGGDAKASLESARAAQALNEHDVRAQRLLAASLSGIEQWSQAVPAWAKYVEAVSADVEAKREFARALAGQGRLDPALAEMNPYLKERPGDWDAQSDRLDWMLATGKGAEAVVTYTALIDLMPTEATAHRLAGQAHAGTEEGAAHFRKALELNPGDGVARRALNQTLAALDAAESEAAAEAAEAAAAAELAAVAKKSPAPAKQVASVESYGMEIRSLLDRGNFTEARNRIEAGLGEFGDDRTARANLGLWTAICAFEEGHAEEAIGQLEQLPTNVSYTASGFGAGALANWKARVYISTGDVRGAVNVLDAVGTDDANEYAQARLWEGMALASLGMDELAERTWSRVKTDVGSQVGADGKAALNTAEFLRGAISEKEYETALAGSAGWANDKHYFLGYHARRANLPDVAREEFRMALRETAGGEFPYHLAQAEIEGRGLTGEW